MGIINTSECIEIKTIVSVNIFFNGKFGILHKKEQYLGSQFVNAVNHRGSLRADGLTDEAVWLQNLANELPDEEKPNNSGEFIQDLDECVTITVGSPVVMVQKSTFSWLDGDVINSRRNELRPMQAYLSEEGTVTWPSHFVIEERTRAILDNIPGNILGF